MRENSQETDRRCFGPATLFGYHAPEGVTCAGATLSRRRCLLAKSRSSLDVSTLEVWLREAACAMRGLLEAPKFKDYILPLIFLKRLFNVFEDEIERLEGEFGGKEIAADLVVQHHELVRFYVPALARWPDIRS